MKIFAVKHRIYQLIDIFHFEDRRLENPTATIEHCTHIMNHWLNVVTQQEIIFRK